MDHDEIIQEVRANRKAYAEQFGFDIRALYRDAKEREGFRAKYGEPSPEHESGRPEFGIVAYGKLFLRSDKYLYCIGK